MFCGSIHWRLPKPVADLVIIATTVFAALWELVHLFHNSYAVILVVPPIFCVLITTFERVLFLEVFDEWENVFSLDAPERKDLDTEKRHPVADPLVNGQPQFRYKIHLSNPLHPSGMLLYILDATYCISTVLNPQTSD